MNAIAAKRKLSALHEQEKYVFSNKPGCHSFLERLKRLENEVDTKIFETSRFNTHHEPEPSPKVLRLFISHRFYPTKDGVPGHFIARFDGLKFSPGQTSSPVFSLAGCIDLLQISNHTDRKQLTPFVHTWTPASLSQGVSADSIEVIIPTEKSLTIHIALQLAQPITAKYKLSPQLKDILYFPSFYGSQMEVTTAFLYLLQQQRLFTDRARCTFRCTEAMKEHLFGSDFLAVSDIWSKLLSSHHLELASTAITPSSNSASSTSTVHFSLEIDYPMSILNSVQFTPIPSIADTSATAATAIASTTAADTTTASSPTSAPTAVPPIVYNEQWSSLANLPSALRSYYTSFPSPATVNSSTATAVSASSFIQKIHPSLRIYDFEVLSPPSPSSSAASYLQEMNALCGPGYYDLTQEMYSRGRRASAVLTAYQEKMKRRKRIQGAAGGEGEGDGMSIVMKQLVEEVIGQLKQSVGDGAEEAIVNNNNNNNDRTEKGDDEVNTVVSTTRRPPIIAELIASRYRNNPTANQAAATAASATAQQSSQSSSQGNNKPAGSLAPISPYAASYQQIHYLYQPTVPTTTSSSSSGSGSSGSVERMALHPHPSYMDVGRDALYETQQPWIITSYGLNQVQQQLVHQQQAQQLLLQVQQQQQEKPQAVGGIGGGTSGGGNT